MLHVYLLFIFLLETSAKQMGCIANVTFISSDITMTQTSLTFDQCSCYQWFYNYSGFNYFTNNQTCFLFRNFTTDYTLQVNIQSKFCFINQPPMQIPLIPTQPTSVTKTMPTSSLIAPTTTLLSDVTTTVSELQWNSIGITVATGNGNINTLSPFSVFVDQQYYIYVAEKTNNRISIWPPNPNGLASSAILQTASGQLNGPPSLYVDSTTGGIYVADESNNRVMFFPNRSTTGVNVTRLPYGSPTNVNAIYLDPNGTIFITDSNNNRIYNWRTNQTVAGGQGAGSNANQLSGPKRFFIDSNYAFYLSDSSNYRIQKWLSGATSGQTVAGGHGQGSSPDQFSGPKSVVVDSRGNVLVCDSTNNRIQKWSPGATTGMTIAGTGTPGPASNQLNQPSGIAVDRDNNLYVADTNNFRVQKFNVF